jgi:hypothetical protein
MKFNGTIYFYDETDRSGEGAPVPRAVVSADRKTIWFDFVWDGNRYRVKLESDDGVSF